jgi:hypothetical protein
MAKQAGKQAEKGRDMRGKVSLSPKEQWVEHLRETFKFSVEQMSDDMDRMEKLRKVYDNNPDKNAWPTMSKIPLPLAWAATEEAAGPALDYLLPPFPALRLMPGDEMDADALDRVEWALWLMLVHRMKLRRSMVRSVKDCFSLGVGYSIVEPITITPPTRFDVTAGRNTAVLMGAGAPQRSLRHRYVSTGKIAVYPQGTDFNGDDPTPYAFFLDVLPEWQYRKLFQRKARDGEEVLLDGDAEDMIERCRRHGFDSQTSMVDFADKMGGRKTYAGGMGTARDGVAVMVPVLKCYARDEGRHTWLFCGGKNWQIIWDKDAAHNTMRCPLVKWDAFLDSDRWFGMNMAEAHERTVYGRNILFNAVNDLVTKSLHRPLLFDNTQTDEPPDFAAGVAGHPGDVTKSARYMDPPRIGEEPFRQLEELEKVSQNITGHRDMMAFNSTRGGSMAFQDLLKSMTGRERLRHMLLETGGFESVVWQTLAYMQDLGSGMDLTFRRPAYNAEKGRRYVENFSVTEDEMKHSFDITLDMGEKHRQGEMDMAMKLQRYAAKRDNPYVDQWAAAKDLFANEYEMQEQLIPRAAAMQKQAEREAAELESMRNEGARAKGAGRPGMGQAITGAIEGGV